MLSPWESPSCGALHLGRCHRPRRQNSEVSCVVVLVAVAVMVRPLLTAGENVFWKRKSPSWPVVTSFLPRKILPSSVPEGLEKNSIVKVSFGVLLSLPFMVVVPEEFTAEVRTGLFCRLLAPVSGSCGSLGVGPSPRRSIPKKPLEMPLEIVTPSDPLKAMVLLPTMLLVLPILTPSKELAMGEVPYLSVPMRLP